MSHTSPIPLLLDSLSVFLPSSPSSGVSETLVQKQIPLHAIIQTQLLSHMHTHTLIQPRTQSAGGVVGRDQRWWNGLCVGRLDKNTNAIKLMV